MCIETDADQRLVMEGHQDLVVLTKEPKTEGNSTSFMCTNLWLLHEHMALFFPESVTQL